jgi:hypothetical protein
LYLSGEECTYKRRETNEKQEGVLVLELEDHFHILPAQKPSDGQMHYHDIKATHLKKN